MVRPRVPALGELGRSAIQNAILSGSHFVALLSTRSVSKQGYVRKEPREAINMLEEIPETDIFLIPVRTGKCELRRSKLSDTVH